MDKDSGRSGSTRMSLNSIIGSGSYGDVYSCTDEGNNKAAVKRMKVDDESGIENPLELSIMSTVKHPYINSATRIKVDGSYVYVFQQLAQGDLSHKSKYIADSKDPSVLKRRLWQLTCGVSCMHKENIIHGDIKGSNVLVYSDGTVKLTDFSLSLLYWGIPYQHSIGTLTHKPPECYLHHEWSFNLDVWSLACTFIEIATGKHLFPGQDPPKLDKDKGKERKRMQKWMMYKCHQAWFNDHPVNRWRCHLPKADDNFEGLAWTPPNLLLIESLNPQLKDLVCSMLVWPPTSRPTIDQIVRHPYFTGMSIPDYSIETTKAFESRHVDDVLTCIREHLHANKMQLSGHVEAMSLSLYLRAKGVIKTLRKRFRKDTSRNFVAGCCFIAAKLVENKDMDLDLRRADLLYIEEEICHYLDFKLHQSS